MYIGKDGTRVEAEYRNGEWVVKSNWGVPGFAPKGIQVSYLSDKDFQEQYEHIPEQKEQPIKEVVINSEEDYQKLSPEEKEGITNYLIKNAVTEPPIEQSNLMLSDKKLEEEVKDIITNDKYTKAEKAWLACKKSAHAELDHLEKLGIVYVRITRPCKLCDRARNKDCFDADFFCEKAQDYLNKYGVVDYIDITLSDYKGEK